MAEATGKIGEQMSVEAEAANSPQLSPPPSPVIEPEAVPNIDNFMLSSPEPKPHNEEIINAPSSDLWTNEESKVLELPTEVPAIDSRCETEQAISTLLMEMDTEPALQPSLIIQKPASPTVSPPPSRPQTPKVELEQIEPPKVSLEQIAPPEDNLEQIAPPEDNLEQIAPPKVNQEFIEPPKVNQEFIEPPKVDLEQIEPPKAEEEPAKPMTPQPVNLLGPIAVIIGQDEALLGKHAASDDVISDEDIRPEAKKPRRSRKKSLHLSIATHEPEISPSSSQSAAGQHAKMSPYDIFEFKDSDDEDGTAAKDDATANVVVEAASLTPGAAAKKNATANVVVEAASLTPGAAAKKIATANVVEAASLTPGAAAKPLEVQAFSLTPPVKQTTSPCVAQADLNESEPTDLSMTNTPDQLQLQLGAKLDHNRDYVTELNQDGKLSLTIRKASNQARESAHDVKPKSSATEYTSFDVDTLAQPSITVASSHSMTLAEAQPTPSQESDTTPSTPANVKPTRRSARLMQTKEKKVPPSDDSAMPKDLTTTSQQPSTAVNKVACLPTPQVARDAINANLTENQPPTLSQPVKESIAPATTPSEALKESQPSVTVDSAEPPPAKTRRNTRGKKGAIKQAQLQQQAQNQQQIQTAQNMQQQQQQQPVALNPTLPPNNTQPTQNKIEESSEQTRPPQTLAPNEPKRPKRLTRLAAKTFGGAIVEQTSSAAPQPPQPAQPQLQQQSQPTIISNPMPAQLATPKIEQPMDRPQDLSANVSYAGPTPTNINTNINTDSRPPLCPASDENSSPQTLVANANVPQPRQPSPCIEPTPSFMDLDKPTPFFVPSYLPPRKRLGWFWSQKQLLEQRYLVVWTSRFSLKDNFAAVQMHFISGDNKMPSHAYRAMLDETGMPLPIVINQRMSLEPDILKGVQDKMSNDEEHCLLLAVPVGRDQSEYLKQSQSLRTGFIDYLISKQAAGIVYVHQPGDSHPSYIIHIFPSCTFVSNHILRCEPDLISVIQNIDNLIVVITTA